MPYVVERAASKTSTSVVDTGAFFIGAVLLALATRIVIPMLVQSGWEPLLAWFAAGSACVFLPLIVLGVFILRCEGTHFSWARLRLRRPTRRDWTFVACGALFMFVASGLIAFAVRRWVGAELAPPFLRVEPLGVGRRWILAVWLPFWILNIVAEDFLWRGVLLPRQEARLGRHAWIVQAMLWTFFHVSFGATVMLLALPSLVVVPFVAQLTRNTWTAVVIHALGNGPPFVLIALGLI